MGGVGSHPHGPKPFVLAGLAFGIAAIVLLLSSQLLIGDDVLVYAMLTAASILIGFSFGLGIPAGMSLAGGFYPERRDQAILYLNSMVAFGAGTAPILVATALGVGAWGLMPLALGIGCAVVLVVAVKLPLELPESETSSATPSPGRGVLGALPRRFWLYGGFMVLYGVVQTLNGNWAALLMTEDIGATAVQGALALTTFWVALGIGRILFGALDRVLPETLVLRVLPFVAAVAVLLIAATPEGDIGLALFGFGLAGLGCSARFPLGTSFARRSWSASAASCPAPSWPSTWWASRSPRSSSVASVPRVAALSPHRPRRSAILDSDPDLALFLPTEQPGRLPSGTKPTSSLSLGHNPTNR